MCLSDPQKGAVKTAVNHYIKYCVNGDCDSLDKKDLELQDLAELQLYNVLCLLYNNGNPDPRIQECLNSGKFSDSQKVIDYIELAA